MASMAGPAMSEEPCAQHSFVYSIGIFFLLGLGLGMGRGKALELGFGTYERRFFFFM